MANIQKMTASEFMQQSASRTPQGRVEPAIHHSKRRMAADDEAQAGPEIEDQGPEAPEAAEQNSRRGRAKKMSAEEASKETKKAADKDVKADDKKAEEAEKHSKRGPRRRMSADASDEPKSEDSPKSPSMMQPAAPTSPGRAMKGSVAQQFAANTKEVTMGPGNVAMTNSRFSSSKLK